MKLIETWTRKITHMMYEKIEYKLGFGLKEISAKIIIKRLELWQKNNEACGNL